MVEAIDYHPIDKKLYAAASLNGGLNQEDFWSESLVIVNSTNANCSYVNEVDTPVPTPETDIDNMAFNEKGILYSLDAAPPGSNYTKIFQFPYMSSAQLAFQTGFLPYTKIFFCNSNLYLISERILYKADLNDNSNIEYIGKTHQETEYNGEIIAGVTNIKYQLNY